jgi:hypothetical protein
LNFFIDKMGQQLSSLFTAIDVKYENLCAHTPLRAIVYTFSAVALYEVIMRTNPSLGDPGQIKYILTTAGFILCASGVALSPYLHCEQSTPGWLKPNFWTFFSAVTTGYLTNALFNHLPCFKQ